jgi:hypothetical protein
MAVDVVTEVEIQRPRDEVAVYVADSGNATAWYRNIDEIEWLTPPPVTVGSRVRFTARFLGRTLQYVYAVREHEPGHRFVMSTAEGPFAMETTYAWVDAGHDATRMTLRNRGRPSGFAKVSAPLMAARCDARTRQTWLGSRSCWKAEIILSALSRLLRGDAARAPSRVLRAKTNGSVPACAAAARAAAAEAARAGGAAAAVPAGSV